MYERSAVIVVLLHGHRVNWAFDEQDNERQSVDFAGRANDRREDDYRCARVTAIVQNLSTSMGFFM
jgi:hypothetical protein